MGCGGSKPKVRLPLCLPRWRQKTLHREKNVLLPPSPAFLFCRFLVFFLPSSVKTDCGRSVPFSLVATHDVWMNMGCIRKCRVWWWWCWRRLHRALMGAFLPMLYRVSRLCPKGCAIGNTTGRVKTRIRKTPDR